MRRIYPKVYHFPYLHECPCYVLFSILKTDPGWLSPGMQIEKCELFPSITLICRLDLIEITRDTPTTIRCETIELDDVEKISETISFRIKGKIFFCLRLNFDDISKLTYCRNQWPDNRSGHHHSDGFLNFICGWNRRRHKIVPWSGNEIRNISINSFYVILIKHEFSNHRNIKKGYRKIT